MRLPFRKRRSPRDSTYSTAQMVLLVGECVADYDFSQLNLLSKCVGLGLSQKKTLRNRSCSTAQMVLLVGGYVADYDFSQLNLLSKGIRCGLDKEIALDETYLTYFSFRTMIERSQMTPFHDKFVVKSCKMWCIAKEDPLGIVLIVQPEGSYFLGCAADCGFSQQIKS